MIAVDTNILVYAHRADSEANTIAFAVVQELASGRAAWAIPWPCIYEFFSVVTNPRIWRGKETSPEHAWRQIEDWLASPSVVLLREADGFIETLAPLLGDVRVRGPIVHDARIAALCIAHGVTTLLTRDRDFSMFGDLQTRNPLQT